MLEKCRPLESSISVVFVSPLISPTGRSLYVRLEKLSLSKNGRSLWKVAQVEKGEFCDTSYFTEL